MNTKSGMVCAIAVVSLMVLCAFAPMVALNDSVDAESAPGATQSKLYVALGDSATNGYGMPGYNVKHHGILDDCGTGAYPQKVQSALNASTDYNWKLTQLGVSAMRIDDLRYILDDDFQADGFTHEAFMDGHRFIGMYNAIANTGFRCDDHNVVNSYCENCIKQYYRDQISKADVITLAMGSNNFGTFISQNFAVYMGNPSLYADDNYFTNFKGCSYYGFHGEVSLKTYYGEELGAQLEDMLMKLRNMAVVEIIYGDEDGSIVSMISEAIPEIQGLIAAIQSNPEQASAEITKVVNALLDKFDGDAVAAVQYVLDTIEEGFNKAYDNYMAFYEAALADIKTAGTEANAKYVKLQPFINFAHCMVYSTIYSFASYIVNYDAVMSWILENNKNPDLVVITNEMNNMIDGMTITYNGVAIPLAEMYQGILDAANFYTTTLSPYAYDYRVVSASVDGDLHIFLDQFGEDAVDPIVWKNILPDIKGMIGGILPKTYTFDGTEYTVDYEDEVLINTIANLMKSAAGFNAIPMDVFLSGKYPFKDISIKDCQFSLDNVARVAKIKSLELTVDNDGLKAMLNLYVRSMVDAGSMAHPDDKGYTQIADAVMQAYNKAMSERADLAAVIAEIDAYYAEIKGTIISTIDELQAQKRAAVQVVDNYIDLLGSKVTDSYVAINDGAALAKYYKAVIFQQIADARPSANMDAINAYLAIVEEKLVDALPVAFVGVATIQEIIASIDMDQLSDAEYVEAQIDAILAEFFAGYDAALATVNAIDWSAEIPQDIQDELYAQYGISVDGIVDTINAYALEARNVVEYYGEVGKNYVVTVVPEIAANADAINAALEEYYDDALTEILLNMDYYYGLYEQYKATVLDYLATLGPTDEELAAAEAAIDAFIDDAMAPVDEYYAMVMKYIADAKAQFDAATSFEIDTAELEANMDSYYAQFIAEFPAYYIVIERISGKVIDAAELVKGIIGNIEIQIPQDVLDKITGEIDKITGEIDASIAEEVQKYIEMFNAMIDDLKATYEQYKAAYEQYKALVIAKIAEYKALVAEIISNIEAGYAYVIAIVEHTFTHEHVYLDYVEATCTESGNIAYWYCPVCDTYALDYFGIQVVAAADVFSVANGHVSVITKEAEAATCTVDGCTAEESCAICGEVLVESVVIPAIGHDYVEKNIDGTFTVVCNNCGDVTVTVENAKAEDNAVIIEAQNNTVTVTKALRDYLVDNNKDLVIVNGKVTVTFDKDAVSVLPDDAVVTIDENPTLTDEQKAVLDEYGATYVFAITINDGHFTFSKGKLMFSIAYTLQEGDVAKRLTVFFLGDDASVKDMKGKYANESMTFAVNHNSVYFIAMKNAPESNATLGLIFFAIATVLIVIAMAFTVYATRKDQIEA